MNVYARFDEIPTITLKDIKKIKCYGRTDGWKTTWKQYTRPQTQFAGDIMIFFSSFNIFAHIFIMYVTHLQSFKRIQWKP